MARIQFYFDYISHNAYLAWVRLQELAEERSLEVVPVPVLFAGLLNHHGQLGPAEVPAKRNWMLRNVLRKAADLGIPLNPPHTHPFNPLLALRASGSDLPPAKQTALVTALFRAAWEHGRDMAAVETVRAAAEEAECEPEALLAHARSAEGKQRLRSHTEQAIREGVFGVPAMLAEGELFWGYDELVMMERHLDGDAPRIGDLGGWTAVRPAAVRRLT